MLKTKGLTCDQTIEFTGVQTSKKCPIRLRRIGYRDAETGKHYINFQSRLKKSIQQILRLLQLNLF